MKKRSWKEQKVHMYKKKKKKNENKHVRSNETEAEYKGTKKNYNTVSLLKTLNYQN